MGSEAVSPAPLGDQVFTRLHDLIVNRELPPDSPLRVRDLAERLGTSVMPVREAISRLEEAGLVTKQPYRGAVVRGLTVDELTSAYSVRMLLESEAARLGAEAIDDGSLAVMAEHWEGIQQAATEGRVSDALGHDEHLLTTLYQASANPVLMELIRGLWDRCRPYKVLWASSAEPGGGIEIWSYKPKLIEAARSRDGAAAAQVLQDSLVKAKSELGQLILNERQGPG